MPLFLLEFPGEAASREELRPLFDQVAEAARGAGGEFIEAQVTGDLRRVYVVVEHADEAALTAALDASGVPSRGVAEVRLVGATLDQVKQSRGGPDYLVEWDFPAGLTMDTYLERKKAKSPLYAQVPEVSFLRTYVCEDMSKCLCFYLAQDEDAVRRAREVVSTPISRLHRLDSAPSDASPTPTAAGATGA
ncbi:MAG TPA: DUF4242 domain-containing protein [Chloroflexota bacterium]|nr:DUF4242 domain-containing protein [Chloroflexota bacterium]